jgi:hypothetical protein
LLAFGDVKLCAKSALVADNPASVMARSLLFSMCDQKIQSMTLSAASALMMEAEAVI